MHSECIITFQDHIHEWWGYNLCPVQTEEPLETASTKKPVEKYKVGSQEIILQVSHSV